MATRAMKFSLFIFLLFAIVVSASQVLSREDPELLQCQHQCRRQRGLDHEDRQLCEERCEDYIRVKKQRERSEREEEDDDDDDDEREEPYEYEDEDENPYLYQEEHFDTRIKTEEGRVEILEKFTERSNLLRGIENYRVGFLRANPGAFVSPVHFDADVVFFVAYGRPTVSLVREEKTENHNLEPGHILRVPAGIPVYMINRDEREELFIVKLIQPVANPGSYQAFYGPGGEDPESFYTAFSWEVLEHAFKMDRSKLERLFRQQKQGSIMRATKAQVRQLSQKGRSIIPLPWPFPGDAKLGSFDLLRKRPSQANQFGQLYEADARDYMQLQDLDVMVSFANITRGAMSAPYYNSKATKIAFVVYGEGHFEMACPHLSSSERQRRQRSSPHYERVGGRLRRGTVFVAPAGHPVTIIASQNSNLQVVCFEVNARANTRFLLTGKNNIVNRMERVAKELSFNVPAREVDRIFGSQQLEFFFPGPNRTEGKGRAYE